MKRLVTAIIGVPIVVGAVLMLPSAGFLLAILLVMEMGVVEYVAIGRRWAPDGPLRSLLFLVPVATVTFAAGVVGVFERQVAWHQLLALGIVMSIGLGLIVLFTRTPVGEAVAALGLLAYGIPYFAVPAVSLYFLQRHDPWVLLALLVSVWMGDGSAYYVGRRWGRTPFAPSVSPKKTWEGFVAHVVFSVLGIALWLLWRQGGLDAGLLGLGVVTSVMAQLGDLVESALKRGAGIKDSGRLLPGHGGFLDRIDALLFAAPTWLLGLWVLGYTSVLP